MLRSFRYVGIARGCGWQDLGAYVNLIAYYLCGIPVAAILGFWLQLRGQGLWIGIQVGAFVQSVLLAILTSCQNWKKQVSLSHLQFTVLKTDWSVGSVQPNHGGKAIRSLPQNLLYQLDLANRGQIVGTIQFHSLTVRLLESNPSGDVSMMSHAHIIEAFGGAYIDKLFCRIYLGLSIYEGVDLSSFIVEGI